MTRPGAVLLAGVGLVGVVLAGLILTAGPAMAHAGGLDGGGDTGAFEMPAWVVWVTGAGVVAVSFGLVGVWLTPGRASDAHPGRPVEAGDVTQLSRTWVTRGRVIGLVLLLGACMPAFFEGTASQLPGALVWVLVWSGLPIIAYMVGNIWLAVSPFRALGGLADKLRGGYPATEYPERLGAWPSVLALLVLIGIEVTPLVQTPRELSWLVLAYTLFTIISMAVFGSRTWLANAEVFDRAFAWWSSMAPFQLTEAGLERGPWGHGLTSARARDLAGVGVGLALLYGVNYDAFLGTGAAAWVLEQTAPMGALVGHSLVLVGGYGLFVAAFMGCVWALRTLAGSHRSIRELAGRFVVTLVPIAAAYHLAHNLVYVLERLPVVAASLSDPIGIGWDLFGTASWSMASVPTAWAPWIAAGQMGLIVAGHVLAVIVAHRVAFASFPSRVQAVKSELPLTGVMVLYTLVGLWLVSQGHGLAAGGI